jgi:hypothetical protein
MPVTIATWEAEIGRIVVLDQPGQKKFPRPPYKPIKKLGMMVHACNPSQDRKHK